MKSLCLHGYGTSAAIFESQTAAFRARLPKGQFDFDFIDGPHACSRSAAINAAFASAESYSWWASYTVPDIRAAVKQLYTTLKERGPFDNVCGFSQGTSLLAALLLYHAKETPNEPLPFQTAVFICGSISLVTLEDLDLPITDTAREIHEKTGTLLTKKFEKFAQLAANPDRIQRNVRLWDDTSDLLHDPTARISSSDVFGLNFDSFPSNLRIKIPTIHVLGAKDPRWPIGRQLAQFCDDKIIYDHGGGHEIPKTTEVSAKIADLFMQSSY